jgi:hypothetical protein
LKMCRSGWVGRWREWWGIFPELQMTGPSRCPAHKPERAGPAGRWPMSTAASPPCAPGRRLRAPEPPSALRFMPQQQCGRSDRPQSPDPGPYHLFTSSSIFWLSCLMLSSIYAS